MSEDSNYIDPEYRNKVYLTLKESVSGFNKTPKQFEDALKSKEYVGRVFETLKESVNGFNKDISTFESLVYENPIQKKNQVGNGDSTVKETPSVSSSKIQPVTSLGGEKIPTAKASATSTGVKITPFKGFSKEEMTQMKKPESVIKQEEKQPLKSVKKAPLYAKQLKLQRELSTAVVTPENLNEIQQKTDELAKIKSESLKANKKEPDFVDSLVSNLDVGLFSISKAAVKDAPEFAFDLVTTIGAKAADVLGDDTLKAMTKYKSDDVAKILGFRNLPAEELQRQIDVANNKIQEYNNNNGGDAITAISNGNYLGASKIIAGSTVQSLPLVLAAMTTGGGALPTIFATSASMEYGELKKNAPEMSDEVKLGSAIGVGIFEGFLGKLFSGASGLAVKRILADKGVEEGSKIVKRGIISSLSNVVGKNPVVGLVGEMGEEGSVEFGNQTIQILNGTRKDYDIKGIGNAAVSSSGIGLTSTTAVYGAKGYMKIADYKKAKNVNKEIDKSINELSNPILTDTDKQTLSNRIDRLSEENRNIVKQSLDNIKSLPTPVKNEVYDINNNLEDLKIRTLDIQDNSAMSQETKETLLSEIKREANDLVDRRSKIIDGTYIYDDFNKLSDSEKIDRKDKAGIELLNEAKAKGAEKVSFDDAQITKKAVEDYGNERKQRSDREAANQEKPTRDQAVSEYTQPTGEGEKGVRSVQEKVETLRQDEQQELLDAIPNASNALTDGKVDKDKLTTPEDKAKFDEIYDKYDKLITPLLEVTKPAEAKVTTTEKTIETNDFDLKLPNNKDNIIVVDTTNGFALYNSETNRPVEVLNENAGKENVGISKPYATQEEAQARIEELKTKPTEIKATPDVVSQPIDLTVPSKVVEAEVKPTEPTVAETPIIETPKESKARQTLVDKTKNAEAELKTVLAKNIKPKKTTVKKQPTLTEQLGITKKPAAPKSKTGKVSKDEVVPNVVVTVPDEMSIIEESKPTKSVDIVKTSDNGLLHASNFEGIPYEIEGGIGLVQGFSPFGNVVYAPYKGEYRIRTDVSSIDESSKQTMLNKDELARLKELRNNLESQESKNESESKNPFEQQGRVASSDSVPTNVRDFVKEITDSLGITSNIFIITDGDFNESQYKKHGLFGKLASIRSAILSSKDSSEWGHKRAISSANANYIYYGGNLTESQVFSVVAHEVGHIVESELFNNASPETKAKVKADYDAWFAKLNGKTVVEVNKEARDITLHDLISNNTSEFNTGSHGYISSFSEYLADNVGKWVRSSENPKTLVDKFFSNIAEEFKKIYNYVFKTGNYSKSMFEWLDEQYLSNKKQGGAVSTDASLSKMKGAGESYNPKGNSENQSSINKAILKYAVNKIALGTYDVNAFVKDMASNGIELTKEGADFLFDKSQKAYKTQIEKLTGVSRKPSVGQARQQKVINKSYSVGVATQKIETEAQKQKAKSDIADLKDQYNAIISVINTIKDADKKEALQKQADGFKEKIADIKAKLAESETEVKDLKGQVRDVFKAAVEAVRQAKANARTDAKAYSDFVAMKQAALADYLAKNLSGKITAKEAASIIMSVSQATDKAIEDANKLIGKVSKRTEREAKDKLKESIKENLKEGKITSSKKGVKNIKVTLSAKRYLLDARKIDLESMDIDQLTQLDKDIEDVLATGVATRNAMNEVIKRRRRDIEAEAIVRYERKFKQGVESDNIDMYETLKAKNIVILEDGTVFFPEDYKQTEFMPPEKGTVISENATKQQANKSFLDKSGFPAVAKYVYSKLGEIPKYHFSLTYRFYDILSDTESQDFFNKNVFDKLEKFRNRVDNRATNYSKSLNDKIYGTQPVNKKLSTLFKSNLFKTARVFAKKEGLSIGGVTLVKKGVTENIEFGQTDLVLEERTGKKENILKGATNSEVINLYNSLRDYKFLTKTFMKGGRFDLNDALKVINYVNQNPELRRRAEALVDTYAEIAVDLSAKMDEIGKNLNVGEYLTEDEYRASSLAKNNGDQAIANAQTAQYMSILRAFYGNNIPKIIPYVPISAEKVSSESSTGSEILDGKGFYNPSLAFPNLLERKGGGNLVLKSYQESFDEYTKNVSRFIEGNDLLSDFTAMFNGDHSKKILTQQFGEQWVKKANDGLVETILENDRSLNSPMAKFISLGAVNVLLFNPTSATSQLSSAPGFLASLNEAERKEYFKIMKDSNKRKEYQSKILNSNYIANRANMSNHEYDAAMLKRLSTEGGMFSFGGLVGDFISDAMILTSLSDAASIVYGGSGLFGVKYEAKLKEYLRTMNRADASKKAEEEAMLDLASASEKTQQSSQVAFVSEFRRNPVLRALGATAFASSSLQAGEMAIKSFRDLKNGRGDKKENIKKVLYFGTLAPTIFTLTAALIRGAFDDDDDPLVKVANDALNTSLEQLTTVGKVVAMVKDYYLEQYAPEAVGLRMKYNTDDNDLIVKYGSDFSPGLGVKVRDIKAAIDSKGKRTIVERGAAGVQAATNVPLKRMVDIGTNFSIAFNSEYANMVRLKGLFLQIPESERFKHREHIESIKKQANELVRLSPEQSIVASKIKDPIEKKRFVDDALLERKFKFINYRLNEWFKDGYSDTKNAERMQQEDDNAIEDITENYLRDYVDATLNKDDKAVVESLDKLLDRIDYYEKNNSSAYAAIDDKLDSKITEILKEDVEYFASVKQFSKGRPRAVAIYSKIGAMLTEDFESPGAIGMIRALDSEGLLDDSTIKEYYKYVQEKKREAK